LKKKTSFFVLDQAKQLKRCTPALEWMRDVLIKLYPEKYNFQYFKGFTSSTFRKTWANMGEELEDPSLRDYGPKSLDNSRVVTEKFYLNKRMATTANFSKAVAKAIGNDDDHLAILVRKTMFAALRSLQSQLKRNQESGPAKAAEETKKEDEAEREEPEENKEDDE
jgi:hypothetical protein